MPQDPHNPPENGNSQVFRVIDNNVASGQPRWLAELVAACARNGLPALRLSRRNGDAAPQRIAFRLRTGERFAVDLDDENHDYLRGWLRRERTPVFVWFETADGCLVGLNLAHVEEMAAGAGASGGRLSWTRDGVTLRFADGTSRELPKIAGEAIDYFQGATLRVSCGERQHSLRCTGETVTVDLGTLSCVTLPAAWLDEAASVSAAV